METTTYIKKEEGIDYRFVDEVLLLDLLAEEAGEMTPIEILGENIYQGIIYIYGRTNISEKEDSQGTLEFQFKVLNKTEDEKAALRKDPAFIRLLGEILNSIIIDDLDYAE